MGTNKWDWIKKERIYSIWIEIALEIKGHWKKLWTSNKWNGNFRNQINSFYLPKRASLSQRFNKSYVKLF